MEMHNELKAKLKRGEVTFGVTLGIGFLEVPEALANLGLDYLTFDMQHTSLGSETTQAMIQATSYSSTMPIVRVMSNDLGLINKALDIGAYGVIIPLVNTKDDAARAIHASRYAPEGIRSWGPRRQAMRDPEYAKTANTEIMIIPQVETTLAVKNIEDIVTTEGVEAVFIGPNDLSMSLGVFGQFDNPKFLKAIEKVVSTCQAHGVSPGMLAPAGPVETTLQQGFKMIQLGGDLIILTEGVMNRLRNAKNKAETLTKH
jgi:2-keto-3-deoxy-L-rhamnonate aldolase RhmA